MEAIKKKMQAMKLEKDNAMDRADLLEQQAKDANLRAERVRPRACRGTGWHEEGLYRAQQTIARSLPTGLWI